MFPVKTKTNTQTGIFFPFFFLTHNKTKNQNSARGEQAERFSLLLDNNKYLVQGVDQATEEARK